MTRLIFSEVDPEWFVPEDAVGDREGEMIEVAILSGLDPPIEMSGRAIRPAARPGAFAWRYPRLSPAAGDVQGPISPKKG